MLRFVSFLALLAAALADVRFTAPDGGAKFSGSSGPALVKIAWEEDGANDAIDISKADSFTISLCAGTNSAIQCFKSYLAAGKASDNLYTASIKASDAPNGNFFFQVLVKFPDNAQTIHYTDRFSLSGMSGSATTKLLNGTPTTLILDSNDGAPDPQVAMGGAGAGPVDSKSFELPYTAQTGATRFAPMQQQPGTTVTMTTWTRQFPTSSVLYALTFLSIPFQKTTITPGWNYTMQSAPNWAAPATFPNQWYAPKERVTPASLTTASKQKRWQ